MGGLTSVLFFSVVPGRREAANYGAQLRT